MTISSEENSRSKELLLEGMDCEIISARLEREKPGLIAALIMNRNRVARFLNLPTRCFKNKEKEFDES